MTKTEYRKYIISADWQGRRKEFLKFNNSCERCEIPRWLAEIAYDQDLNVHHKSYKNLGAEDWDDLESLCRRCHEIEKFNRSDLREPKSGICTSCEAKHWNPYNKYCAVCDGAGIFLNFCHLCGGGIWGKPLDAPDFCKICQDISNGDPKTLWKMAAKPFADKYSIGDVILFGVLARFGVDKVLDFLSSSEKAAVKYNAKQIAQEKLDDDIPF